MKTLTATEKENWINEIEREITNQAAIPFQQDVNWKKNFPKAGGVYFGYLDGKLMYIGETAELYSRMDDLRKTYNHTLRKKLGKLHLKLILVNNKFEGTGETVLNDYMESKLSIKAYAINFGRKEVEDVLVEKYKAQLLNSVSLRGKK